MFGVKFHMMRPHSIVPCVEGRVKVYFLAPFLSDYVLANWQGKVFSTPVCGCMSEGYLEPARLLCLRRYLSPFISMM